MTAEVLAWLLGLGGIAAGFATGYFVAHHRSTDVRRQLETEQRLQEAEERLGSYREEVEGHFRTTADLVNRLTSDYRDVHNHLAAGARQLCGEPGNDAGEGEGQGAGHRQRPFGGWDKGECHAAANDTRQSPDL